MRSLLSKGNIIMILEELDPEEEDPEDDIPEIWHEQTINENSY